MIELHGKPVGISDATPYWGDTGSIILSDGQEYGYIFPPIKSQEEHDSYMYCDKTLGASVSYGDYWWEVFNREDWNGTERNFYYDQNWTPDIFFLETKHIIYIHAIRVLMGYNGSPNNMNYTSDMYIDLVFPDYTMRSITIPATYGWYELILTDNVFFQKSIPQLRIRFSKRYTVINRFDLLYKK